MNDRRVDGGDEPRVAAVADPVHDDERMRAAVVELLLRQVKQTGYANCALVVFVGAIMWTRFDSPQALGWIVAGLVVTLPRFFVFEQIRRRFAFGSESLRLELAIALAMLLSGLHWGAAVWLFLDVGNAYKFSFLTAAVLGVLAAAMSTYSVRPLIWFVFAATVCVVSVAKMLTTGNELLAVMSVMVLATFTALSHSLGNRIRESITQDLRNARLLVEVRNAKEMADLANRQKSVFMAATSHDLRQPLHAQSLLLDVLAGRVNDGELADLVGMIKQSNAALNSLFDALLEVSQLDAGTIKVQRSHQSLRELCHLIVGEFHEVASRKGLTIEVVGQDRVVLSDPVLLARVLRNLVSNAIKFTESGGVTLRIHEDAAPIRLSVIDTGVGVAESDHELIFNEFAQLGNQARDRSQGIGLGLALVRRMCALLEHPLTIDSSPGQGSRFTLTLLAGEAIAVVDRESDPQVHELPMLDVMIIDNEQPILDAMQTLFADWSCPVRTYTSASAALMSLERDGYRPDLILSDYRLDESLTGLDAIRLLRNALGTTTPAIVISGDTDPGLLARFEGQTVTLLHKPLKAARLKQVIAALV